MRLRRWAIPVVLVAVAASGIQSAGAAPEAEPTRQPAFADAAHDFGVPEPILLATAYNQSRWEQHAGQPSTTGAYGVMGLVDLRYAARGDGDRASQLYRAAELADLDPATVRTDAAANIRAGAALLADYADSGQGWYDAVARYGGSDSFARSVFATIQTGERRTTADGETVTLAAAPDTQVPQPRANATRDAEVECPATINCQFIPAAYELNDPDDPSSYGNYDVANRPKDVKIDTIVLHDTEGSYDGVIDYFTDPAAYVSAHYLVRSSDGEVTQFVPTKDVAWQAGNWYVNSHSIGIEQEGYAIDGSWYTEALYRSTAELVKYLAAKYDIPLDRQHIIGHDNVPGISPDYVAGMHWDPGTFWDWEHFMSLIGTPVAARGSAASPMVTIAPGFDRNVQQVNDCEGDGSAVEPQGVSFVWLRTAPRDDAPLYSDPALHPDGSAGTTCANDWGDKASAGQQFVVAEKRGDWIAIWWQGAKVWFKSGDGRERTAVSARGTIVTPKPGRGAIPTYGRAYPEPSAYPDQIPVEGIYPLQYTMKQGQSYVSGGLAKTDYYYAKTIDDSLPLDHSVVRGKTKYLRVQLGHRIGFVQAADVTVRAVH